MGPINYNLDVQTPFQSALQGYQAGAAIRNDQLQQQQQQLALQQKQQQAQVLQSLVNNPNAGAADYSRAMTVLPGIADKLKTAWDTKNTDQQQSHISDLSQWGAAIQNGRPEIAVDAMRQRADAMESAAGGPTPESQALRANAGVIEAHPNFGGAMIKMQLASFPGGDKVIDSIVKLGAEQRAQDQAPADLLKKQADASKAATAAKFAESDAALDLQKKGWDISKIQNDMEVSKQNVKIAAMNAAANREANTLKRQELQLNIQAAKQKRDDVVRQKASDAESARTSIDNFLNTADQILATPGDVIEHAAGPISSKVPTIRQDTADFEELMNGFDAKAFQSQVAALKGMGALSDAEGKKLTASLQNFSMRQSPERLIANVKEAQRLVLKARKNVAEKFGVPDTVPDRPSMEVPGLPPGFKILGKE